MGAGAAAVVVAAAVVAAGVVAAVVSAAVVDVSLVGLSFDALVSERPGSAALDFVLISLLRPVLPGKGTLWQAAEAMRMTVDSTAIRLILNLFKFSLLEHIALTRCGKRTDSFYHGPPYRAKS